MKIGLFTDTYFPHVNGVVSSVETLRKELIKRGHQVTIITINSPQNPKNSADIIKLPGIPFPSLPEHKIGFIYSFKTVKEIRKLDLDIIHTHTEFSVGILGRVMARFLNIPVVHTYHTMYEEYVHYLTAGKKIEVFIEMAKKYSKIYCKSCDSLIVPSQKTKDALLAYGLDKEIKIIPTGIKLEHFFHRYSSKKVDKLRENWGINKNNKVLLYVGRLAPEKSVDVLISGMKSLKDDLPQVRLVIVGDGPERDKLEKRALKLGLEDRVIFTGEQPWSKIGIYYQLGDIYVNASVTETQGLTFIEAMASGLPVVARYDTNLKGVIQHGKNGYFFKNKQEFSSTIKNLLLKPLELKWLGENSRHYSKEFSSFKFGLNVEKVYQETILQSKKPLNKTG
ncbi:MAG: glycosyltransferase family 4 protein [Bacillota bacterium]